MYVELKYHSKYIAIRDYVIESVDTSAGRLEIIVRRQPGTEDVRSENDVPAPHGIYAAEELGDGRLVLRPLEPNELAEALKEIYGAEIQEPTLAQVARAVAQRYVMAYAVLRKEKGAWVLIVKPAGRRKRRFVVAMPLPLGCNRVTDKDATLVYEHPDGIMIAMSALIQ